MRSMGVLVICGALFLSLIACTGTQKGATVGSVLGAGAGAIIGHQKGKAGEGAAIGAVGGGLLGALAGDHIDNQKDKQDEARREGYDAGRRDAERGGTGYQSDYR